MKINISVLQNIVKLRKNYNKQEILTKLKKNCSAENVTIPHIIKIK